MHSFITQNVKFLFWNFRFFRFSPLWVTVLWCRNPHMVVFWCHIYLEPFGVVFEYYGMFLCILNHLCICFAVYSHEKCPCKICFVLLVNNCLSAFGLLVWTAVPLRKSFETVSDPTGAAENIVFNCIFSLLTCFVVIQKNVLNYLCLIKLSHVKSKQLLSLLAHGSMEFVH